VLISTLHYWTTWLSSPCYDSDVSLNLGNVLLTLQHNACANC